MNGIIDQKIKDLVDALRHHSDPQVVSFNLFVNCQHHEVTFSKRTTEDLEAEGVSMRNLGRDFIG